MTEVVFKLGLSKKGHPQVSQIRSVVTSSVGFFSGFHVFFCWIFWIFQKLCFFEESATKEAAKVDQLLYTFFRLKEQRFSV